MDKFGHNILLCNILQLNIVPLPQNLYGMNMSELNAQKSPPTSFAELWQNARLLVTEEFTAPPVILRVGDSTVATLGNFSASTGKAKSKKTFNVCAIVASALTNSRILNYSASLPENKRKIIYVDTEQSKSHCHKVLKRILQLSGLPVDSQPETLDFLYLRRFSPKIRLGIIEEAIYHTENLGLVIIDGVRDLAYDINSPSEATDLITKLMQWTDERQIHIHTVLHPLRWPSFLHCRILFQEIRLLRLPE
jgi:hypothetical protein